MEMYLKETSIMIRRRGMGPFIMRLLERNLLENIEITRKTAKAPTISVIIII
jgi:hypothetical protein